MNEHTPTPPPTELTSEELAELHAAAEATKGVASKALQYTLSPDGIVMTPSEARAAKDPDSDRHTVGTPR